MIPRISSVLFMALFLVSIGASAIGTAVYIEEHKAADKTEKATPAPKKSTRLMYKGLS